MKFEDYIINQIDKKYKEMLLNNKNISHTKSLKPIDLYETNKKAFYKRLNQEKNNFNSAIDSVSKTRQNNLNEHNKKLEAKRKVQERANNIIAIIKNIGTVTLSSKGNIEDARNAYDKAIAEVKALVSNYDVLVDAENRYKALLKLAEAEKLRKKEEAEYKENLKYDRKLIIYLSIIIAPIVTLLILALVYFTISKDANIWYNEVVVREFGFQSLITPFSDNNGKIGSGVIAILTSIVLMLIGWVVATFVGAHIEPDGGHYVVLGVFGVGLLCCGISLSIPAALVRLLLAIIVHLIQIILYPWVVICILLSIVIPFLILKSKMKLKKSKTKALTITISFLALNAVLLSVYSGVAMSNSKKYSAHNGAKFESAFNISGEGTYSPHGVYVVSKKVYYKIVTNEKTSYTFNIDCRDAFTYDVYLYDEQKQKIDVEINRYFDERDFAYTFESDRAYYLLLSSKYYDVKYTIDVTKTPAPETGSENSTGNNN